MRFNPLTSNTAKFEYQSPGHTDLNSKYLTKELIMKANDAPTVLQMQDGRADIIELPEFATLHTKNDWVVMSDMAIYGEVFTGTISPQEVQIELLQRSPKRTW